MTALVGELIELACGDELPAEREDVRLDLLTADAVERLAAAGRASLSRPIWRSRSGVSGAGGPGRRRPSPPPLGCTTGVAGPALTFAGELRWDVVRRLLDRLPQVRTVLEVGAGRGAVGARLARRYDYLGLEPDTAAQAVAAGRARVVRGTTGDLEPGSRFDLVCAFEVLEHIEDDEAALRDWAGRGDLLLLSVPAHRRLWGAADEAAGHVRRYDPGDLRHLLARSGLEPAELVLYGFPVGYALKKARDAVARRRPPAGTGGSGRWLQPPDALGAAIGVAALPFRLLQRAFPDRGTGIVCLARRVQ